MRWPLSRLNQIFFQVLWGLPVVLEEPKTPLVFHDPTSFPRTQRSHWWSSSGWSLPSRGKRGQGKERNLILHILDLQPFPGMLSAAERCLLIPSQLTDNPRGSSLGTTPGCAAYPGYSLAAQNDLWKTLTKGVFPQILAKGSQGIERVKNARERRRQRYHKHPKLRSWRRKICFFPCEELSPAPFQPSIPSFSYPAEIPLGCALVLSFHQISQSAPVTAQNLLHNCSSSLPALIFSHSHKYFHTLIMVSPSLLIQTMQKSVYIFPINPTVAAGIIPPQIQPIFLLPSLSHTGPSIKRGEKTQDFCPLEPKKSGSSVSTTQILSL